MIAFLIVIVVLLAVCFVPLLVRISHAFFFKFYAWKFIHIAIYVILYFVLTILLTIIVQCWNGAKINYQYIKYNSIKIFYIFHIICLLLLWSISATSFRSMCLPALCASFKQWRTSRYLVSARPTWISFWIPGFASFSVKKFVIFLSRFPCMRKCCQAKDQENTTK